MWEGNSIKQLVVQKNKSKRNLNFFRCTTVGIRKQFRVLDLYREDHLGIPGMVCRIEYDPNRTSFISLLLYKNNICTYVLCPSAVRLGDIFINYLSVPMFLI